MKTKAQKTREPADEVFRSLIKTMGLIRQVLRPHFDRHEIGRAQFMVLGALHQASEQGIQSLTIGKLSKRMIVRPPSMTGVIHKLQGLGLVNVAKSETDARTRDVSLSEKGWELMESMLDEHGREIGKLMVCLSVAEQEAMVGMLGKLSEHLIEIQKAAPVEAAAGVKKNSKVRNKRAGINS